MMSALTVAAASRRWAQMSWKSWTMFQAIPSSTRSSAHVCPALMAHILASKYGYHLPLYRQSQMFGNEGIELSGSLLASPKGQHVLRI